MTSQKQQDEFMLKVLATIRDHGWMVQGVLPHEGDPGGEAFFYTVGLTRVGHPELLIHADLNPKVAAHLLNDLGSRICENGRYLVHGMRFDDLLAEGYECAIQEVDFEEIYVARQVYGGDVRGVYQIVLPDAENRLPWDEGYHLHGQRVMPCAYCGVTHAPRQV